MIYKDAKWISCEKTWQAPLFRKKFFAEGCDSAAITITSLGFFDLYINGTRVGEEYFRPVWTDYEKRDLKTLSYPTTDQFTHRLYYLRYDVSDLIKTGLNSVAVMLGNGWYRQKDNTGEGERSYGDFLKLIFDLEISYRGKRVHIYSDGQTLAKEGHILYNNIYFGEIHDLARFSPDWTLADSDDRDWTPADLAEAPDTLIEEQPCPCDKVIRTLSPILLKKENGICVFDAGENVTGWTKLIFADDTAQVIVRYAEEIDGDKNLDFASCGTLRKKPLIQKDIFVNAKAGQTLSPVFCWHGFRYFETDKEPASAVVEVVHSDVKINSYFESDNETLNWLYKTYLRTQLDNMHAGVPSDCPHRERLGYTGDGQLISETAMLLMDARDFFAKWIRDVADSQDLATGHVQHTAPFAGGGGGPGGWGSAIVIVPYNHYMVYGNPSVLETYFDNMLAWLRSMKSFCRRNLVVKEIKGGWCLGDWCVPAKKLLPPPFVNTVYYIYCMELVEKIGGIIGREVSFADEIARCKRAVRRKYYSRRKNTFWKGRQGADAFACAIGLGNPGITDRLTQTYSRRKCFDTGIFGTPFLLQALSDSGDVQTVFDLLSSRKYPSFGFMMDSGATTLWEYWDGRKSHNHPMFGAAVKYLFYSLLGIRREAPGFAQITFRPRIIIGLNNIKGGFMTPYGEVSSSYRANNGTIEAEITLPAGIEASLEFGGKRYSLREGVNSFVLPQA